jgi:hypothetical protein
MAKTRTRHRPPRIFIKNGKIYVRIGKKRYLLKDQKKYSKEQLIDIILKNLLVRRKRRKKGKLTKREKRLNLKDLKTFEAFEKLNRSRRGSNLVLPAGLDMSLSRSSTEQSFLNALVKFSGKVPKDINVANRESSTGAASTALVPAKKPTPPAPQVFTDAEYQRLKTELGLTKSQLANSGRAGQFAVDLLSVERKVRDKTKKKTDILLPWKERLEAKYGITIDAKANTSMTDYLAKLANAYPNGLADDDFYKDYLAMRGSLFDTTAPAGPIPSPPSAPPPPPPPSVPPPILSPTSVPPSISSPPSAPPPPPGRGNKFVAGRRPPAPLAMFSFTSDSEMKSNERAEYERMKKATLAKFNKGQLVAKRKLLQQLIADENIPIKIDRTKLITSGAKKGQQQYVSTKGTSDLAKELFDYYEQNDARVKIPTVFNTYFPAGINAVAAPAAPVKKTPISNPGVDMIAELKKRLEGKKTATPGESIQERLERDKQEREKKEETGAAAFLRGIKLKQLPTQDVELIDAEQVIVEPDEPVDGEPVDAAAEQVIDQTAAGLVVRTLASQNRGQPLSTNEIDAMMRSCCARTYIGTYPADFMKFLPKKLPKVFSFVMNTDPSGKPGKHWVAVRVNTMDENAVEYYDSFAEQPSKRFMKQLKSLINKLDVPVYLKLKINKIKDQNTSTNNCGWFAMGFIINRNLGIPFRECTGFDDSHNGEDRIDAMKNKFGYV